MHLNSEDAYTETKAKLQERCGSNFITAQTYRRKIRPWPKIAPGDARSLRQFADYLESCEIASRTIAGLEVLSDPDENIRMLQLLPRHMMNRWERVVDEALYEPRPGSSATYPSLGEFVNFLKKEARVASGPVGTRLSEADQSSMKKSQLRTRARTFLAATNATTDSGQVPRARCKICGGDHSLDYCQKFLKMSVRERHDAVLKHSLCRGCLKPGHVWRTCKAYLSQGRRAYGGGLT